MGQPRLAHLVVCGVALLSAACDIQYRTVQVLTFDTHEPIAGARVRVLQTGWSLTDGIGYGAEGTTDSDGKTTLLVDVRRLRDFDVSRPGFQPLNRDAEEPVGGKTTTRHLVVPATFTFVIPNGFTGPFLITRARTGPLPPLARRHSTLAVTRPGVPISVPKYGPFLPFLTDDEEFNARYADGTRIPNSEFAHPERISIRRIDVFNYIYNGLHIDVMVVGTRTQAREIYDKISANGMYVSDPEALDRLFPQPTTRS